MARKKLTDEERAARRKITTARYRLKKGHVPGAVGKPPQNEERTVIKMEGATLVERKPKFVLKTTKTLDRNSTPEDIYEWIIEVCQDLKGSDVPAAWAAAASNMYKVAESLERRLPPPEVKVKPRPRIAVVIEED
ncbi:MAG: hypothetical protein LBH41_00655 [Rickettsiales bacterium]|jgi:hypothetical protein|nr:hypothetical protein [Rickettsiales bacterium]